MEQAYRDGRKDERIACMLLSEGVAWCQAEDCNKKFGARVAHTMLDFAHDFPRSKAQGYRPGKGGQNDRDFRLLCRSCHRKYDAKDPQWSGADG